MGDLVDKTGMVTGAEHHDKLVLMKDLLKQGRDSKVGITSFWKQR